MNSPSPETSCEEIVSEEGTPSRARADDTPILAPGVAAVPDSWENRLPQSLLKDIGAVPAARRGLAPRACLPVPNYLMPMKDCPWCIGMGEGTVADCECGRRICEVCADVVPEDEGKCSCGWHVGQI